MNFDQYIVYSSTKRIMNRVWSMAEKCGCEGIVDKMAVPSRYAGRKVMNDLDTNAFIADGLQKGDPFMVGRFGAVELNFIYNNMLRKKKRVTESRYSDALNMLCFNAGFFPNVQEAADKFANIYIDSVKAMDLCGVWGINLEDYLLEHFGKNCRITRKRYLEPWFTDSNTPWTRELIGKKVLIVHPFVETMKEQYRNRTALFAPRFDKDDILPPMQLEYLKSVQSIGGQGAEGFTTWFDAYDYMLEKINKIDYDVAVLGCGAYGLPLAAKIKESGKQAIHLGGALQIWFGIRGKRWDKDPTVSGLYNDYWISPSESEKPQHANGVEGGCYW